MRWWEPKRNRYVECLFQHLKMDWALYWTSIKPVSHGKRQVTEPRSSLTFFMGVSPAGLWKARKPN